MNPVATPDQIRQIREAKEKKLWDWLDLRVEFEMKLDYSRYEAWMMYRTYRESAEAEIKILKLRLQKLQQEKLQQEQ